MSEQWVLATHNAGKAREITTLLAPYGIRLQTAGSLNLPEPEETGNSFAANALLKARAACQATRLPALADDSGFGVAALNHAPGIYAARWAGAEKNFAHAMQRVWQEYQNSGSTNPAATFTCALALCWPDGREQVFTGEAHGSITWPPRGNNGFGYDPIFIPNGATRTFGEMSAAEKEAISHRTMAFRQLVEAVFA